MTTERIKEIQSETAYPNSVSVQQALLKVWNECEQEKNQVKSVGLADVGKAERTFYCDNCEETITEGEICEYENCARYVGK